MNWKKLETFKEISKYKSFNHASKVLKNLNQVLVETL